MRAVCAFIILALAAPVASAQVRAGEPHTFLRTQIGFTDDQIAAIDDDKVVTKIIETGESREVAIAGVVRIRATTSFFLRMFRDIERFDTAAIAVKKISSPPILEDFDDLSLPESELKLLRKCRIDACGMKLGEEGLDRLERDVDWDGPNALREVETVLRELGLGAVEAYLEGGSGALGAYRDKKNPVFIADELGALLDNSPYILAYRPELHDYLLNYPNAELAGSDDFIYWASYDYGKPVIRLSHVTIYSIENGENASAIVTGKHLWFTHYFMTGLDLHALVRDEQTPDDAFFLVSLIRVRTDIGGLFGSLLKKTASGTVLENVHGYLESSKAAIERYYQDELARRR